MSCDASQNAIQGVTTSDISVTLIFLALVFIQ